MEAASTARPVISPQTLSWTTCRSVGRGLVWQQRNRSTKIGTTFVIPI
jgi:hypothetical protein